MERDARRAWLVAAGVTAFAAAATVYGFHPSNAGSGRILLAIGGLYAVLCVGALRWLRSARLLKLRLMPKRGDITLGFLLAAGLYGGAALFHGVVTPRASERHAWMMRLYLQIGELQPGYADVTVGVSMLTGLGVMVVAALEEVTWRGWVMQALARPYGPRPALWMTTGLYTVAHLATLQLLRDPDAGLNPLVVIAALGCGLVWGLVATVSNRLPVAVCSHALFSWAVVEYPLLRL